MYCFFTGMLREICFTGIQRPIWPATVRMFYRPNISGSLSKVNSLTFRKILQKNILSSCGIPIFIEYTAFLSSRKIRNFKKENSQLLENPKLFFLRQDGEQYLLPRRCQFLQILGRKL